MSIMAAIDLAVRLQLLHDRPAHAADYDRAMGGAPIAGGHGFTETQIDAFLQRVAARLKLDTPSLNYDWARADSAKCLNANREVSIGLIARDTTVIKEAAAAKGEG
jgi:hypothetical protein